MWWATFFLQTMRHKLCGDLKCSPFDIVNPDGTECSRSAQTGNGMNIQIAALLTQYLLLSFHLKGTPDFCECVQGWPMTSAVTWALHVGRRRSSMEGSQSCSAFIAPLQKQ